jgi:hypothetical protein
MPNKLAQETSPYLRQHAENPVDWYPWGEEALRAAREADKPILLSPSVMPPATGATSWPTNRLRTRRRPTS